MGCTIHPVMFLISLDLFQLDGDGGGEELLWRCACAQMHPEPSCAPRQQAHRPTVCPRAEAAQSTGPSPTSDPWGGPSRARGSDSGAWDLLRQEKSRQERGRGQARSEQGHCPPSPAPEEGPLGQEPPKQLVGMSLTHRTQQLEPGNRAAPVSTAPGRNLISARPHCQRRTDPRWPGPSPCSQGRDRQGSQTATGVQEQCTSGNTLHAQHCSFQFFLSV